MTKRNPKDISASVQARLLEVHRKTGEDHTFLLIRYALERFLYRLGRSTHAGGFVLKGAMLFAAWTGKLHRPTKDLDLLGMGDASEDRLKRVFADICGVEAESDGLRFDVSSIEVEDIREDQEYEGKRVRFPAYLGKAKIPLQVDIGFGDAITPTPELTDYPTILKQPAPRLRAYPRETVVASYKVLNSTIIVCSGLCPQNARSSGRGFTW